MKDELYHYGILGQKWGVRRFQPYPASYTGSGHYTGENHSRNSPRRQAEHLVNEAKNTGRKIRKAYRENMDDIRRYRTAVKNSHVENMSDQELNNRITRLDREKRYKNLEYDRLTTGQKAASKILYNAKYRTLDTFATAIAIYAVKELIERKYGKQTINKMFPKKK